MNTKKFIEKAIEGGANLDKHLFALYAIGDDYIPASVFLDPKAWEAVGKVEGWWIDNPANFHANYEWELKMHQMIDHLISGGTIESYLETL